ncbi:hypothetical protein VISI1226_04864 [Vibrio sinaloensis DSM 21326]|uniref:Lcl C-terminal domain-containing protein n=1 Tax=Vibrio sinaloensis DSM 21326 TaxID=945550 RepID=E8M1C7_PHOS4|nr:DUF1566 domain-containing protein [Vibrio sinaloensis]EGA72107.1 hypothetical protein VISI1226_04864 [Vibrio sinaloensis DSM 21326]
MKKFTLGLALTLVSSVSIAAQECSIDIAKTAPNIRYVFNDNGTVKDKVTGLTWMRCPLGQTWNSAQSTCTGEADGMFWQSALSAAQDINTSATNPLHQFAGVAKWRLPNIKEVYSLSEFACYTPALNSKAFSGAFLQPSGDLRTFVWSNTHDAATMNVYAMDTRNSEIYSYAPSGHKFGVLLVADQ